MNNHENPRDITFTATLGRVRADDTWTCVQLPDSATIFGTVACDVAKTILAPWRMMPWRSTLVPTASWFPWCATSSRWSA